MTQRAEEKDNKHLRLKQSGSVWLSTQRNQNHSSVSPYEYPENNDNSRFTAFFQDNPN